MPQYSYTVIIRLYVVLPGDPDTPVSRDAHELVLRWGWTRPEDLPLGHRKAHRCEGASVSVDNVSQHCQEHA